MAELRNVSVSEALVLVSDGALLLDVREDNEWSAGRALGAIHIPLNEVPDGLDNLTKQQTIVCVCRSGVRSARAAVFLQEHGFDAVNLEGGMLTWSADGELLESDAGEPAVI